MQKLLKKQNLGIRDLQAFHQWFDQEKQFDTDMLRNIAYLSEEVGEVVNAVRTLKRANDPASVNMAQEHLGDELADCLAYILKLANYAGIDLQEAYRRKMERNLSRTWYKKVEGETGL